MPKKTTNKSLRIRLIGRVSPRPFRKTRRSTAPVIAEIRVKSVPEYLRAVNKVFKTLCTSDQSNRCELWYRGQAETNFDLLPTITRKTNNLQLNPLFETVFLSKFKSLAIPFVERLPAFPLPGGTTNYWSWLFMLRHYGLPARIMDWSRDALTGLFFATDPTDPSLKKGIDAAVWVLNPVTLNKAFIFHSFIKPGYIPNVEEEAFNRLFGPESSNHRPKPAAAIGPLNTTRIVAQRGTFTVFPLMKHLIAMNKLPDSAKHLFKIIIAWQDFKDIQTQLKHYGITRLSLFPDIDIIANEVFQQVLDEGVNTIDPKIRIKNKIAT
ncbi:MAG: FRG domain-containing protein [Acidobacteriota bacterium]